MKILEKFLTKSITSAIFHVFDALAFYLAVWSYQRGHLFLACFCVALGIDAVLASARCLAKKEASR